MKKISFILFAIALLGIACNMSFPTNQMGFFGEDWFPAAEVLCSGKGFSFGACIAKEMKDSTCIGIAKFDGSHIAVKIPCNVMFQTATDTIELN